LCIHEDISRLSQQGLALEEHHWDSCPHPLEADTQAANLPVEATFAPEIVHPPTTESPKPLALVDIYIDDFIGVAQCPLEQRVLRTLLNAITSVFRQETLPNDNPNRKQTISASKLTKGDGCWSTSKNILGWDFDTAKGIIQLPAHKADRLVTLLKSFQDITRTSRKKWFSLLGELLKI